MTTWEAMYLGLRTGRAIGPVSDLDTSKGDGGKDGAGKSENAGEERRWHEAGSQVMSNCQYITIDCLR